jgi:hypothetical protein
MSNNDFALPLSTSTLPKYGPFLLPLILACLAGCQQLQGFHRTNTPVITPSQLSSIILNLGDMPGGFRMVQDMTPNIDQIKSLFRLSDENLSSLKKLGHQIGSYRTFTYTTDEPGVINGVIRITIQIDILSSVDDTKNWSTTLQQGGFISSLGTPIIAAAPGKNPTVRMQSYQSGDTAATDSIIVFIDANVAAIIATTTINPGISLSETERFADTIHSRINALG